MSFTSMRKENNMPSSIAKPGRSVAITGAGAGLGREIALGFAAKGYTVFGTAMSDEEVQNLKNASDGRVRPTICDMTQAAAVPARAGGWSAGLWPARLRSPFTHA